MPPTTFMTLLDDTTTVPTAVSKKEPAVSLSPMSAVSTCVDQADTQHENTSVPDDDQEPANNFLVLTASIDRVSNDTKAPTTASEDGKASTSGQ